MKKRKWRQVENPPGATQIFSEPSRKPTLFNMSYDYYSVSYSESHFLMICVRGCLGQWIPYQPLGSGNVKYLHYSSIHDQTNSFFNNKDPPNMPKYNTFQSLRCLKNTTIKTVYVKLRQQAVYTLLLDASTTTDTLQIWRGGQLTLSVCVCVDVCFASVLHNEWHSWGRPS